MLRLGNPTRCFAFLSCVLLPNSLSPHTFTSSSNSDGTCNRLCSWHRRQRCRCIVQACGRSDCMDWRWRHSPEHPSTATTRELRMARTASNAFGRTPVHSTCLRMLATYWSLCTHTTPYYVINGVAHRSTCLTHACEYTRWCWCHQIRLPFNEGRRHTSACHRNGEHQSSMYADMPVFTVYIPDTLLRH